MEIATEKELDARQVQYDAWIDKETKCSTRKSEIQEVLNFENYLGSELYGEFCAYRRDQDYSNDNYISDGLNNTDLFSNAREFIKTAQEELKKAATLQCNISCKVKNLFALDEFKPFWDSFQIGNWITVGYDNEYYRLRVISINGSLSDFSNIDVEFSSVTRISNVTTNIKDVLNQAQSMATNYSYISRQSNNGQKANDTLSEFQKKSINAALYMIKNNDEEGITIDNHGITARAWNDILGDFDPEQLIITHNVLGFTDDNFASLKTALGKVLMPDGTYKYGLNAEVVIGTFLLGKYLELENENGSLKFNGDGFVITNGINTFTVNPNNKEKLLSISSNSSDIFYLDTNGKLHIQGEGAGLDISSNQTIAELNNSIGGLSDSLDSEIKNREDADKVITETTTKLDTRITETAKEIKLEASKTYYTKESATSDFATADSNAKNYANNAENNANSSTDNKLKDYSTTKQMNAALSLTAEGIKQTVSETYSTKDETSKLSSSISQTANAITAEVTRAQGAEGALDASLSLKLGRDENDQVVSMINASADQIKLTGNRLIVECDNFELDSSGRVHIIDSLLFDSGDVTDIEILGHDGKHNALLRNVNIDLESVTSADGSFLATKDDIPDIPDMSNYVTTSSLNNELTNYINNVDAYEDSDKGTTFYYSIQHSGHDLNVRRRAINTSDERLKVDILPLADLTDIYMSFEPISYHFNPGLAGYERELQYGLSAQKIEKSFKEHGITDNALVWKVAPDRDFHEDVYTDGDLVYHLDKDQLHAMHIQMIQKQQHEIEQLKSENFTLKGEVYILKQRLGKMEEMLNVINSKIN